MNRRSRTIENILSKTIWCFFAIIGVFFAFISCLSASDFYSLDGDNREEKLAGQSKSFFLRKEYSLTKPYQGPWNLAGSALISADRVRLTPPSQSQRGAVWSRLPVHIRHWEAHLSFRVFGNTGKYFGDGLAFWYVHPITARFPGPALGGPDKFRGLAVFLDTYSNAHGPHGHFHPYLSAVVNNGSAIVNHQDDGEQRAPVGCTAGIRNRDHETLVAIRYVDATLTVSTDVDNAGRWQRCFRVNGVRLPTHYVFGVSALTGDLVDSHEVISMKVYEVESTQNPDDYSGEHKLIEPSIDGIALRSEPQPASGDATTAATAATSTTTWLTLLGFAALLALAAAGVAHRSRSQRRKKRFY